MCALLPAAAWPAARQAAPSAGSGSQNDLETSSDSAAKCEGSRESMTFAPFLIESHNSISGNKLYSLCLVMQSVVSNTSIPFHFNSLRISSFLCLSCRIWHVFDLMIWHFYISFSESCAAYHIFYSFLITSISIFSTGLLSPLSDLLVVSDGHCNSPFPYVTPSPLLLISHRFLVRLINFYFLWYVMIFIAYQTVR